MSVVASEPGFSMRDLEAFHTLMHAALRGELPVDEAAARLGVPSTRLGIYRDFVFGHVRRAVESAFPATLVALGARARPLLEAYERAHSPPDWRFRRAAEAFPEYLEATLGDSEARLHELARFEWTLGGVADAPDLPLEGPPGSLRLEPTLDVHLHVWRTVEDYAAWQSGETHALGASTVWEAPRAVFVYRHPVRSTARWLVPAPPMLLVFKLVHDALPLEHVAAEVGLELPALEALVNEALDHGFVTRLSLAE
jgi:hypothetical protein